MHFGKTLRIVIDTNLWVSYLLKPDAELAVFLDYIKQNHTLLYSQQSLQEITHVLMRSKFRRYFDLADAQAFLINYVELALEISISTSVTQCRDPKDNHLLALALDGQAGVIISGDKDLLALHPFQDIPILSPAEAMKHLRKAS